MVIGEDSWKRGCEINSTLKKEYQTYLASIEWASRRLCLLVERKCRSDSCVPPGWEHWHCEKCFSYLKRQFIEVHHKTYENLGHEKDEDLMVVCSDCHTGLDKERAERSKRRARSRLFLARLDGWGKKVYGKGWKKNPGVVLVRREFEAWLEAKGKD
jgi:hypothetical protein